MEASDGTDSGIVTNDLNTGRQERCGEGQDGLAA